MEGIPSFLFDTICINSTQLQIIKTNAANETILFAGVLGLLSGTLLFYLLFEMNRRIDKSLNKNPSSLDPTKEENTTSRK